MVRQRDVLLYCTISYADGSLDYVHDLDNRQLNPVCGILLMRLIHVLSQINIFFCYSLLHNQQEIVVVDIDCEFPQ